MRGEDVKAIRQAMGLSQAQFSDHFRINLYTLRQWERKNQLLGSVAEAFVQCVRLNPEMILTCLQSLK